MAKYYLGSNQGFYDDRFHSVIPDGAVRISDALYWEVMANRPPYKVLSTDANGLPCLIDAPLAQQFVPRSVTMRQGREALIRRGKIDLVEQAIASMPGVEGDIARNMWERSQTIERSQALTAQMFAVIGVNDDAARDEWFIFAATL